MCIRDRVNALTPRASSSSCLLVKERCAWYRVKGDRGWLWAEASELSAVSASSELSAELSPSFSISPPAIEIEPVSHYTRAKEVELKGVARCPEGLEDVMIYVNNRKVFFLSKTEMKSKTEASFSAKVPLEEGVNIISVYARHSEHRTGQELIVITRPKGVKD